MILGCGFVFAYYKVKFLFYKEPVPTYIYLGRKESEDVITNNKKTKKDNKNKKLNIVNSPLMAAELANIILSSHYHTILRKPIYVHLRNKSIWDISAVDKDWTIYTYGGGMEISINSSNGKIIRIEAYK